MYSNTGHALIAQQVENSALTAISTCTHAIDRYSRLRHLPTRALAYQNAAYQLRQSGCLSGNHDQAAKVEFFSHSCVTQLNVNTNVYRSKGCILPNTFSAFYIRLWPSCHSDLGGSTHGWGLFLEQTEFLHTLRNPKTDYVS